MECIEEQDFVQVSDQRAEEVKQAAVYEEGSCR